MLNEDSKIPEVFECIDKLSHRLLAQMFAQNTELLSQQYRSQYPLEYALQKNKMDHFNELIRL